MSELMSKSMNLKCSSQLVRSNYTQHKGSQSNFIPFFEKNLSDLDINTIDSDDTSVGQNELMDELEVLRKRVVEEEVRCL